MTGWDRFGDVEVCVEGPTATVREARHKRVVALASLTDTTMLDRAYSEATEAALRPWREHHR